MKYFILKNTYSLAHSCGGGGNPRWFFLLHATPFEVELIFVYLHFCSQDRRKISSLYGLLLVRCDPILEVMSGRIYSKFVMSGRIYSKFNIAPKAEL